MNKSSIFLSVAISAICLSLIGADTDGCNPPNEVKSSSGVGKADVKVETGADGLTVEQRNIAERLKRDNEPGSIKHMYVISSYTGDVLIYSTVKGKVTSGSKRLSPSTVSGVFANNQWYDGFDMSVGNAIARTKEVLGDDGTYGSSGDYLYWFDSRNVYHQQYAQGCIIHLSDQPLPVKHIILNMELKTEQQDDAAPSKAVPATKNAH